MNKDNAEVLKGVKIGELKEVLKTTAFSPVYFNSASAWGTVISYGIGLLTFSTTGNIYITSMETISTACYIAIPICGLSLDNSV